MHVGVPNSFRSPDTGRRARGSSTMANRCRAAAANILSAIPTRSPGALIIRGECALRGRRNGLVVRRRLPRTAHRQRRSLRHAVVVRGPSDHAAAELRARHQPRQRLFDDRPRQRSRPLQPRPHHGRLVARRRHARFQVGRHRQGEGRIRRSGAARGRRRRTLVASLRTDGKPATLEGSPANPTMVADAEPQRRRRLARRSSSARAKTARRSSPPPVPS